jgi:hypothetical protein
LADIALSSRSIFAAGDVTPLAGVLLGKTSLNSLYGLLGGLPQTVPQFLAILIRSAFRTRDGAE